MLDLLIPLVLTTVFGALVGTLCRLMRWPGRERPLLFPLVGLVAGITAFFIHWLLNKVTGAPAWWLPLLVIAQIWLWLGPLGPMHKLKRQQK
ncbi:hypothetical protein FHR95_000762 [Halomonas fontilapidosi]|uniref:Uncharacterized protein n=1 Tax=Halomonas fontilapidosi TaxID=616675 RepID=A0A7W5DHV1_9GAMM|nr:hypothetical protein [Halomonas fontilapidosi]MBB3183221.1 hypothetical protein [Halomonas fontilapidosi]